MRCWSRMTERDGDAPRWTPTHHHAIDEHLGQNSASTRWRESRQAQGYEQLNCYHSYMPYLPTYRFEGAHDQQRGQTKFNHDRQQLDSV